MISATMSLFHRPGSFFTFALPALATGTPLALSFSLSLSLFLGRLDSVKLRPKSLEVLTGGEAVSPWIGVPGPEVLPPAGPGDWAGAEGDDCAIGRAKLIGIGLRFCASALCAILLLVCGAARLGEPFDSPISIAGALGCIVC
jgi:hypothetical protein